MKNLVIIRHSPSEANDRGVIAGAEDVKLGAYGIEVTKKFCSFLKEKNIYADNRILIMTGTQKRLMMTAEFIGAALGAMIISSASLNERSFGSYSNISVEEFRKQITPHIAALSPNSISMELSDMMDFNIGGVGRYETNLEVQLRLTETISSIIDTHQDYDTYIYVASTGTKRNMLAMAIGALHGSEVDKLLVNNKLPNCSMTEMNYDPETVKFVLPGSRDGALSNIIAHISEELRMVFAEIKKNYS